MENFNDLHDEDLIDSSSSGDYFSAHKAIKKGSVLPRVMLAAFCLVCLVLLIARFEIASLIYANPEDPISAHLDARMLSFRAFFVLLFLPLVVTVIFYLYSLIAAKKEKRQLLQASDAFSKESRVEQYMEQYRNYSRQEAKWWKTDTFCFILIAIQTAVIMFGLFFSGVREDMERFFIDYNAWNTQDIHVHEGQFFLQTHQHEHNFWLFNSGAGTTTMRVLREMLPSNYLMRPWYSVEYLPGTHTVVSITNSDGDIVTGRYSFFPNAPHGTEWQPYSRYGFIAVTPYGEYWLYGDLVVQRATHVHGYDLLTLEGQRAFDLLYGEYFSHAVMLGEAPTHVFNLWAPIPTQEFRRVIALYNAATSHNSTKTWRYATDDSEWIQRVLPVALSDSLL